MWLLSFLPAVLSWLTGGSLQKILNTIDKTIDNSQTRDQVQAEVTKTWVNAQAQLMVGRTWWFQLFFVIPLGFWWSAIILDTVFQIEWLVVGKLPAPLDSWAGWIVSALFLVDGSKAVIGRLAGK